jgi:hypothetical protein
VSETVSVHDLNRAFLDSLPQMKCGIGRTGVAMDVHGSIRSQEVGWM